MSSLNYSSIGKAKHQRFGEWLRRLREERKLPLRAVAAAAEMDQAHLSKVELCQRLLTAEQAATLAKFFKVNGTEMEARRIAEKFLMEHADNPAALQALQILNDAPLKSGKTNS
jgi:transcriptional regulator with XRE-family HTH domain